MKNNIKKSIISHFKKRKSGELNINPPENKAIPQFIPSSLLNREKENQKDKISPVLSDVATALSAVTDTLSIFSKQNKIQQNSTTINNVNKNINSNIANNDRRYSYNYKTIQKIMSPNQNIPAKLNNMGVRPEQNVNNINNVKRYNNFNKNIQILKKMHNVSLIQNKSITNKTNTQDITNDNQHTSVSNILNKKQTNVNKNASNSYRISKHTIQKIRDGRVNIPKEIKGYKEGGWIPPSDNGKGTLVAMAEGRDPEGEFAIPGKLIPSQKSKSLPEILQEKKSTSRTEPKNILNIQKNNKASFQIEKSMNKLNNLVKQIGNKNASSLGENASLKMEKNSNNRNIAAPPASVIINNNTLPEQQSNNNMSIIQQNNRAFLQSQTAFPKWRQGFG